MIVAAAALGLVAVGAALAQPPPTIPMPSDLKLDTQADDVPASVSRFAGAWAHGAWDGVLPHVLVVEAVDGAGRAQVVYALGDFPEGNVSRAYRRMMGHIDGDVLAFDLGDHPRVAYRFAGDALRGTYTSGRRSFTVTLTRATLADVMRVPATAAGVVTAATVRIPMTEPVLGGKRVTLEATLYRPAGDGQHPVLLFNHGSTGGGTVAATTTMRPSRQAPFFVERGFAVLAPMRRARGGSEGVHAELEGACEPGVLGPGLARAIEDVDAAVAYLRAQPWADPNRLLIGGQSRAEGSCPSRTRRNAPGRSRP